MCYVIITCWTLLWTLLSIASFMMIIASIMSPYWLVGTLRKAGSESIYDNQTGVDPSRIFSPSIGIFNRCTRLHHYRNIDERETCATFVTEFNMPDDEFPDAWKAALVFFAFTALILLFVTVTSIISLCTRSVCGKSIFTVSGLLQSIAGLLCIIGLILYPAGWGSATIKKYCGEYSSPFEKDKCSLGWSFYLVIAGTVLTFLCAFLSIKADSSTSSRKVEEEVLEGKNLICVV
ncbi:LHFPL tetraspan subfamily member 2a protein-like [Gigantopelta aegis]|uniref:LHFPL tetraspan subfamily member 2a protein-like n=1 Tax=Gigantopelta aegis TaxID=1735272 RepID=UPI001B88E6FF|nr:LHFPL tetraspan subfamily member 2a protein-like [Gigantopelta aegis]XP_041356148.1 LHFPL tetraspan subfamily member 2a protein-like [Gigantopelta aegis]